MEIERRFREIKDKETFSRLNAYIVIGNLDSGKTEYLKNYKNFRYIDFEEISHNFFSRTKMTLKVFDNGKFFQEIKSHIEDSSETTIIDNLEVIENILYMKSPEGEGLKKFFKDMMLQSYKGNVIFVLSDIKKMKIEKYLRETMFPEKNIIKWESNNED